MLKKLKIRSCEHHFCRRCIEKWFIQQKTCPIDRKQFTHLDVKPANRTLLLFLSEYSKFYFILLNNSKAQSYRMELKLKNLKVTFPEKEKSGRHT